MTLDEFVDGLAWLVDPRNEFVDSAEFIVGLDRGQRGDALMVLGAVLSGHIGSHARDLNISAEDYMRAVRRHLRTHLQVVYGVSNDLVHEGGLFT